MSVGTFSKDKLNSILLKEHTTIIGEAHKHKIFSGWPFEGH